MLSRQNILYFLASWLAGYHLSEPLFSLAIKGLMIFLKKKVSWSNYTYGWGKLLSSIRGVSFSFFLRANLSWQKSKIQMDIYTLDHDFTSFSLLFSWPVWILDHFCSIGSRIFGADKCKCLSVPNLSMLTDKNKICFTTCSPHPLQVARQKDSILVPAFSFTIHSSGITCENAPKHTRTTSWLRSSCTP
jgi:hypothetical protein